MNEGETFYDSGLWFSFQFLSSLGSSVVSVLVYSSSLLDEKIGRKGGEKLKKVKVCTLREARE